MRGRGYAAGCQAAMASGGAGASGSTMEAGAWTAGRSAAGQAAQGSGAPSEGLSWLLSELLEGLQMAGRLAEQQPCRSQVRT